MLSIWGIASPARSSSPTPRCGGRSAWPVSSTPIPSGCPTPCANRCVNSGPLLEVVCRDNEALLALINDVIRAIAGVRAPPRTFTYLHFQNQTYSWGMG